MALGVPKSISERPDNSRGAPPAARSPRVDLTCPACRDTSRQRTFVPRAARIVFRKLFLSADLFIRAERRFTRRGFPIETSYLPWRYTAALLNRLPRFRAGPLTYASIYGRATDINSPGVDGLPASARSQFVPVMHETSPCTSRVTQFFRRGLLAECCAFVRPSATGDDFDKRAAYIARVNLRDADGTSA